MSVMTAGALCGSRDSVASTASIASSTRPRLRNARARRKV